MVRREELELAILSPGEELLGYLNPDLVQVKETHEEGELRSIDITHPLLEQESDNVLPLSYDGGDLSFSPYTPSTLLHPGNKVWREHTGDGDSCFYVLLADKNVDPLKNQVTITAEEVAVELSMLPPVRFNTSSNMITIDSSFLATYFGVVFTPGTVTGSVDEFAYNGTISPMALLREIEEQTGCEFEFVYTYSKATDLITRTINYLDTVGTAHTDPLFSHMEDKPRVH